MRFLRALLIGLVIVSAGLSLVPAVPAVAPPETINITAPRAGDAWETGSTQTIRWTYSGNIGTEVKIDLFMGGRFYGNIYSGIKTAPGGSGAYSWQISKYETPRDDFQIQITSTANPKATALSSRFSIKQAPGAEAKLTITEPGQGVTIRQGAEFDIKYTYTGGPGTFRIELLKGNTIVRLLASASVVAYGKGQYHTLMDENQPLGNDYQIRVSGNQARLATATAKITVAPAPAGIQVTRPFNGLTWEAGTTNAIAWKGVGNIGTAVRIELLKDGAVNRLINPYAPAKSGFSEYIWQMPYEQPGGSDYRIRVTSTSDPKVTNTSEVFAIKPGISMGPPRISITSPTAGETWTAGETRMINWTYQALPPEADVKILFDFGANNVAVITPKTPVGSGGRGSFNWKIPGNWLGSGVALRVQGVNIPQFWGESKFTLAAPKTTLMLISPLGGEKWTEGTTQTIRWTYTGDIGSTVNIGLFNGPLGSGTSMDVIATGVKVAPGGKGTYSWVIPKYPLPPAARFAFYLKIVAFPYGGKLESDSSYFTIAK